MLKQKLSNLLSDKFLRNVGALVGGEALSRVFRLALVVFIARLLSPYDYGLAAIILTVREFATTFTMRGGITGKLIQADAKDLKQLTNTAYWLNWIFCIALFVLQCALAFPIAWFYQDTALIWPIIAVGTTYLAIPVYSTQMSLLERDNKLQVLAASMTIENMASNVGTLVLAFAGWGVWSLILPGVILSPLIQIYCAYRYHSWRPTQRFSLERWQEIMSFGAGVVGAQLMDKFRSYLDYLLVGKFLGVELLGLYFFAFNSGLGISLSIIDKFTWAQFPYICEAKDNAVEFKRRYFKSIKTIAYIICPLVILQSALAPFYVPVVFGEQWRPAIPVMILICLSAIPRPFGYAASRLLQAIDRTDLDVKWNLLFTSVFSILLLGVVQSGLIPVAATVLISHIVAIGLFVIWANRFVFNRQRESITREVVPALTTEGGLQHPNPGQNTGPYSGSQPQQIEDSMTDPIQSS